MRDRRHEPSPEAVEASLLAIEFKKKDKCKRRDLGDTGKIIAAAEKTMDMTEGYITKEPEKTTELIEDRTASDSSDKTINDKKILNMHAIKCKCGNILSRRVEHCQECGINIEILLEELRQDFYRINFTNNPKKKDNT